MSGIPYLYLCLVCIFIWDEHQEDEIKKSFPVYWNVPTFQCHKYGLNFSQAFKTWGIRQNEGDQFRGEQISILYDPGEFPALLDGPRTSGKIPRNGGVPQEGSLSGHLRIFKSHVEKLIPNANFKGLGVIDFEHWRPVWRQNWGSLNVYREYSKSVERRRHPFWFPSMIELEASYRYAINAKAFMVETLRLAKRLRPAAKWGYYGYPFCFNYTPNNNRAACSSDVLHDNDGMDWLFSETTAFFPSIYLAERGFAHSSRVKMMVGRLTESRRVARTTPVFPYVRFKYHDTHRFLLPEDMLKSIQVSKENKAEGVVIWGASNDVNTETKCLALANYLETVLGPAVLQLDTKYQESTAAETEAPITAEAETTGAADAQTSTTAPPPTATERPPPPSTVVEFVSAYSAETSTLPYGASGGTTSPANLEDNRLQPILNYHGIVTSGVKST